jgi:predicted nucleic acid-binding protein
VIFDTDVLIWLLRGDANAIHLIESTPGKMISIVTFMELIQGLRSKSDIRAIRQLLQEWRFTVAPLSDSIGHIAAGFMEEYAPSSGLDVPDTLIAATAREAGETLATGNLRHFRVIANLDLKAFRPARS